MLNSQEILIDCEVNCDSHPKKRKSWKWDNFDEIDGQRLKCKKCNATFSGKSGSDALKYHFKTHQRVANDQTLDQINKPTKVTKSFEDNLIKFIMTFGFNSINKLPFIQYSNQKRMDVNYPSLEGVVRLLNEIAPLHLAESWDNVGLLVEPFTQISIGKIVLTIDLTEKVIEEAKTYGTELIISYHPPIFHPLKSLNHKTWKERLVLDCIQCGIAVYSPHTALDAIKDGINDWLLSPFNIKEVRPINQSSMDSRSTNHYSYRLETVLPSESDSKLLERVEKLGKVLRLPSSAVIFSEDKNLPLIINILSENSSTKASMHLSKLDIPPLPGFGVGRIAQLTFPITLQDVINRTKHLLNLNHVRLALAPKHSLDSNINSIAVCAGSGGSVLRGLSVDLLITGEMSHHEVLDALYSNGSSVILCEHTNTERGYLHVLREKLITKLQNPNVEVIVAKSDADPLNIV